jgi:DNA mismatch repair protein MutL
MPDVLASKIAAGEVVQRPASVAKELVENALDAGAAAVTLVLRRAGSELVQVVDDGCGMGPQDALACFGRHATSKLRRIEDLESLATLGFRGEALASIAAVAQVELRTRRVGDEAGTCVRVDGGRCVEQRPCAAPPGTSIAVRNLFYNVPARRNFLKTPATEFKHLVETFQTQALSNPTVAFTLVHDDVEVYRLPGAGGEDASFEEALARRLADLFGDQDPERLVPVAETTSYLSVRGFVGRPEHAKRSRGDQFTFVNGRVVKSRALEHAVAACYGALLPEGRHPFFALFLTVDPRHVDVNVHPTKTEVKFDDERGVYGFLRAVVKKGLAGADLALPFEAGATPRSAAVTLEGGPVPPAAPAAAGPPARLTLPATGFPDLPPLPAASPRGAGDGAGLAETGPAGPPPSAPYAGGPLDDEPAPSPGGSLPLPGGNLRFPSRLRPLPDDDAAGADEEAARAGERTIWQLHNRYVLTPIASGLLLLDQQAAHERILYERALAAMEGGLAATQQLLFPHTLEAAPAEAALLDELLPDLRALGFDVERLAGRGLLVRGVPADVHVGDERAILEDVLAQYRANRDGFQLEGRENLARSLARRSAIKPGHPLKPDEARALIDQLFACRMPYADPGGRPTMVKLTMDELERRFSRAAQGAAR